MKKVTNDPLVKLSNKIKVLTFLYINDNHMWQKPRPREASTTFLWILKKSSRDFRVRTAGPLLKNSVPPESLSRSLKHNSGCQLKVLSRKYK